jgi:predicted nucleic acid-binding protein
MIFVDTCILIDYSKEVMDIDDIEENKYYINSIVQLEFLAGALNKRELRKLNKILKKFELIAVDQVTLDLSVELINEYALSHGMKVYDSIIASTCMIYDLPLWTHNKKDFRFLDIELR